MNKQPSSAFVFGSTDFETTSSGTILTVSPAVNSGFLLRLLNIHLTSDIDSDALADHANRMVTGERQ
jgi:hypothetical protein